MADKNFNQDSQSQYGNQNWEHESNRQNQDRDWTQNRNRNKQFGEGSNTSRNYGDIGYSGDSVHGIGNQNQEDDNRVNYFPEKDDNRRSGTRDYENTNYRTSGNYRYTNNDQNDNWRRYGNENRGSYGNAGFGQSQYGQQNWNQDANRRSEDYNSYGSRNNQDNDWNRRQQLGGDDNNYGRQDWGRANVNTGNNYSGRGYGNRENYDRGYRNEDFGSGYSDNRYGGDTRNYGNANQGGVFGNWWEKAKDKVSGWLDDDRRDRDRSFSGGYRGKGPTDYRRSQDRIREDICDRLTDDDHVDASHIRVQIEEEAVVLSGTVSSREEKRRAEDLVESVSGVRNVENRLRVDYNQGRSSHNYTGNTDNTSGIGNQSGTTNEIIRNVEDGKTTGREKESNKNV